MLKGQKKKNLTDSECNSMVQHLLLRCTKAGKIPMGAAGEVAQLFDCTPSTVRRIWRRASVNLSGSKTICRNVSQRKKSTCGRKRLRKDLPKRIQAIPQSRRYCFRSLAHALGMPKSTLHDYFKRGVFAKYSSVFKPALTESNKVCRLKLALDHVCDRDGAKYFDDMYDTVHVDEKWFFMTRLQKKVYGAIGEKIKQRACKSKHHLLKVMFLTAVARPRWFDGKLGTWHFTEINFLTLQRCLQEVILNKGGNDYKIAHMRKDVLHARGKLPEMVSCDRDAWSFGCAYLDGADYSAHMHMLSLEILQSMEMSAFCTQIEALKIVDDTDADDNLVAALGLVELSYE
ncbi:hypothetical protein DYB37_004356 [Aphanomyces astaci]|uniref:DUF7769 domain-containing protein n=1 Tax=Aphanomyces astaci TaxID=112090 RepID=A0A3R6Y4R6_APHAT|nr:hypothetical protein DYB37_004356 [Aphanomyces astaci]